MWGGNGALACWARAGAFHVVSRFLNSLSIDLSAYCNTRRTFKLDIVDSHGRSKKTRVRWDEPLCNLFDVAVAHLQRLNRRCVCVSSLSHARTSDFIVPHIGPCTMLFFVVCGGVSVRRSVSSGRQIDGDKGESQNGGRGRRSSSVFYRRSPFACTSEIERILFTLVGVFLVSLQCLARSPCWRK